MIGLRDCNGLRCGAGAAAAAQSGAGCGRPPAARAFSPAPGGTAAAGWRLLSACALLALLRIGIASAQAPLALSADIPQQPLADALAVFVRQTGLQLVYVSDVASGQTSKAAAAGMQPRAALARLLEGTGLQFEFLNERSVRIFAAQARAPPPRAHPPPGARPPPREGRGADAPIGGLGEVVVTAAHGDEATDRVPGSIGVWTREGMAASGAKEFATIANLTPGVEFDAYPDYGASVENNIAIRGVNARDGSTTAIYIGDTPIPHDRASSFGPAYPATFDLERLDVLRGPQGLLLGEATEGGAVRFVTERPSLSRYTGFVRGELASTEYGAPSYEAGGAVGGPLIADELAFRVGSWLRRDGGYVDRVDPFTGAVVDRNANSSRTAAAKAALTYAPNDSVEITPSLVYQESQLNDSPAFYTYLSDPGHGAFRNGKLLAQWATDRFELESLRVKVALGFADLTLASSGYRRRAVALEDATNNPGYHYPNPLGPEYPVSYADAVATSFQMIQHSLVHQARLTSADPSARVTWLAGATYVYSHYAEAQDVVSSAVADSGGKNGFVLVDRNTYEVGGYAQLDVRLRAGLSASAGARVESDRFDSLQTLYLAPYTVPPQVFLPAGRSTAVAPRFGLAYRPPGDSLYYVTASKGYRMGGPNAAVGWACPITTPLTYGPDAVWSYEAGTKQELLERRLQVDASVFHLDWHDVQTPIPLAECGLGILVNAGAARSDGFEFGAHLAVTDRLKLGLATAYAHARYTQTVTYDGAVVVDRGDAVGVVPLVPAPWTATASVAYEREVTARVRATLGVEDAYHGRNPGPFTSDNPAALVYAPTRTPNPATNLLNARVGASWSNVDLSLFVNNLLGAQPVLLRRNYVPADTLFYATTFRPRTIGIVATVRL